MAANSTEQDEQWPELELDQDNQASAFEFWNTVLLFGANEGASGVAFIPSHDDDCLVLTVEGVDHVMYPPPLEFRDWLLRASRRLIAGSGWRGALTLWSTPRSRPISGRVIIDSHSAGTVVWSATWSPRHGIVFKRDLREQPTKPT